MRFARAFTLIEILIALTIFSIVAVICALGLRQILAAKTIITDHQDNLRDLQIAVQLINNDLLLAVDRPIIDNSGKTQPAFQAILTPSVQLILTHAADNDPSLTTQSCWQRSAYEVDDHQLIRLTWPVLDRLAGTKPTQRVLLRGVSRFSLSVSDAHQHWQATWPDYTHPLETLPTAARVTLCLNDRGCMTLASRILAGAWRSSEQ